MKKLGVIIFFSFVIPSFLFAQNDTDDRIVEAFGKSHVDSLKINNPALLQFYTFLLTDGYIIRDFGKEKVMANLDVFELISYKPQFSSEQLPDLKNGKENLNILKFNFELNPNKKKFVRFDDSGWAIVFLPSEEIYRLMNESANKTDNQ